MQEVTNKTHEEFKSTYDANMIKLNANFERFRDRISDQVKNSEKIYQSKISDLNNVTKNKLKIMKKETNKTYEKFAGTCDTKIGELGADFISFCNSILDKVKEFEEGCRSQILDFNDNFTQKVRKEIHIYKQFKIDEAIRNKRELEELEKIARTN